jgi:urease accessory protein
MSALAALLQLSSATLPVGAYSYSQGLESAVETGHVRDERTARDWIAMVLAEGMTPCEAVIVAQALAALTCADVERLRAVNMQFLATRETRELLAETLQMGRSMRLLVAATPGVEATVQDALLRLEADGGIAYPIAWAVKIVPLGQNAGQRLLSEMGARVDAWAEQARTLPLAAMTNFLPGQILASMHHEHQHTRLFRS